MLQVANPSAGDVLLLGDYFISGLVPGLLLTVPLSLLARSAYVYPDRIAVIHGALRFTWAEVYARCHELPFATQSIDLVVLPHVLEFALYHEP